MDPQDWQGTLGELDMWEWQARKVALGHPVLWALKERLASRETEDLKGHGVQKVPRVSLGATVTQDSRDLLENRGLKVNLDSGVLQGNRVSKDSLDLPAYLVCPA